MPQPQPVSTTSGPGLLRSYLEHSKDLFTSMILVLPLFILYQVGVMATGGVRNGVDFVTDVMWWASGEQLSFYMLINLVLLLAFGVAIFLLRHRGTFHPKTWPVVMLESTVYALCLGGAVIKLMSTFGMSSLLASGSKGYGVFDAFILSLGAGLYEEIVFRLVGVGLTYWGLQKIGRLPSWANAAVAVFVSSVVFSAIHHIGALGDSFTVGVFMFRFFAGVLLAVIFYLRGFAVAVYTHAIYDIIVMVFK